MWKFRRALVSACVIKLLVFCQAMGSSKLKRAKEVCAVLAVNSVAGFDMLGWGGRERIQIFPPWKVNSLNESSDVGIAFAFSLWQCCHSHESRCSLQEPRAFSLISSQNLPRVWCAAPLRFVAVLIHFGLLLCCACLCAIALDCSHGVSSWQRCVTRLFISRLSALSHPSVWVCND